MRCDLWLDYSYSTVFDYLSWFVRVPKGTSKFLFSLNMLLPSLLFVHSVLLYLLIALWWNSSVWCIYTIILIYGMTMLHGMQKLVQ